MAQPPEHVRIYGTSEPPEDLQEVAVGGLSLLYAPGGLRRIMWHGTELVRGLSWPIRDENWGTYPATLLDAHLDSSAHEFEARLRFSVGDGRLECDLRIAALRAGELFADLIMTPIGGSFATNRAGFTVLHPIQGVAGATLTVCHSGGDTERTQFPDRIRPDQPVRDIAGLAYKRDGAAVNITFEGEVFEMEDQRNWSDASFKTYCVPLVHPFTYQIAAPMRQSLRMTFAGRAPAANGAAKPAGPLDLSARTGRPAPQIGLALQAGWLPKAETPLPSNALGLVRVFAGSDDLGALASVARRFGSVDLEVVVPDEAPVAQALSEVARAFASEGVTPAHVLALRESYLASHQPSGPWPSGPVPNDMLDAVRGAFPASRVMGGMMTNFTELNRCRPDMARCDGLTHSLTPLVHAGDDMSVLETLEALPQIFASAEALAAGKPYRLGLASIGMRSNPYGAAVAENPSQVRRTMGQVDPRHRGLFGAAFAVGVLAATRGSAVEALCLGAPCGPFALACAEMGVPQEGYEGVGRAVYPLFHVARAAAAMAGQGRLALDGLPACVVGYGAHNDGTPQAMLANLSPDAVTVDLAAEARAQVLDTHSFDQATRDPNWVQRAPAPRTSQLELGAFAVAFLDM